MKSGILLFAVFIPFIGLSQNQDEKLIIFEGYLFSEDSVPVENAYLINYRTLKIVATDSTGYFRTYLQEGDSLMINHLSLSPKIVHATAGKATENTFIVAYRNYMIKPVVTYSLEMKYFEKNMQLLYTQLANLGLRNTTVIKSYGNPYNPDRINPGLQLNLSDLIRSSRKRK
ncbi:hypothetical protein [Gaoshiqia sp. Z1-71]|uniref:hypothetical protein n=1 Tax=Gaoshiqia hydrogeniformans TaxID=3290090 RepID=UPI003BF78661